MTERTRETIQKFVPWTWIVGFLVTLIMMFGAYILNDTRASICKLQDVKMDRAEYLKDYEQRRQDIVVINQKLDALPEMIIKWDLRKRGISQDHQIKWDVQPKDKP